MCSYWRFPSLARRVTKMFPKSGFRS
ncbi:hypothetical protein Goari_019004 [Gossypium aridum]|uniref:Uncharacterized protein n=1 Tax=Gossypium aridum TaxID=34290 RepID=A0A7J8WRD7_GOSAI|nr:hypothetical protein [Gossypium aridum]